MFFWWTLYYESSDMSNRTRQHTHTHTQRDRIAVSGKKYNSNIFVASLTTFDIDSLS